jgi:hypothetical protein
MNEQANEHLIETSYLMPDVLCVQGVLEKKRGGGGRTPTEVVGCFVWEFPAQKPEKHLLVFRCLFSRRSASTDSTDLVVVFVCRWTIDHRSFIPNGFL